MIVHRSDYACSLEEVGARLRLSRESVYEVEQEALIKMRIGLTIVELVGRLRGDEVLATLQGRPLRDFHRALADVRFTLARTR
jgi:hypothetical protein